MDTDAIAAISLAKSASDTAEAVEIAMLKQAMAMEQLAAAQILQAIEAATPAPTSYGHKLDILV